MNASINPSEIISAAINEKRPLTELELYTLQAMADYYLEVMK